MTFSVNSTVKEVLADARARAVVEKHVPGITTHPQLDYAMYFTLGEVAKFAGPQVSRRQMQAILDDLAQIDRTV